MLGRSIDVHSVHVDGIVVDNCTKTFLKKIPNFLFSTLLMLTFKM